MSTTLGHALCGVTILMVVVAVRPRWSVRLDQNTLLLFAVLANLPDLDFIPGYVLRGDANAFHSGPTHSIMFCLAASFVFAMLWRKWPFVRAWFIFFVTILSHVLVDAFTGPMQGKYPSIGVPLAWPFSEERLLAMPFTLFAGVQHEDWLSLLSLNNLRVMAIELLMFAPLIVGLALVIGHQERSRDITVSGGEHVD
jgi:inner membrane protein